MYGFQDDIKIIRKLTPGRYPVQQICPPKNGVKGDRFYTFFLRKKDKIENGAELTTEKYLLQIENQLTFGGVIDDDIENRKLIENLDSWGTFRRFFLTKNFCY